MINSWFKTVLILSAPLFWGACLSDAFAQQSKELSEIQQQIKQKQQQISQQKNEAEKLQGALRKAELAIADTAKAINLTQIQIAELSEQQQQLLKQQQTLESQRQQQQQSLANLMRTAYMSGDYDYAKMLLNQQDASKFERTLTYYRYINQARQQQLDEINSTVAALQQVNAEIESKQQQLAQVQSRQQQQQQKLTLQQTERKQTLTSLNKQIASESARVAQLQANEKALIEAIQRAQEQAERDRLAQQTTLNGLAGHKGKLIKPTNGRVRKLFGARRQGQVRWKGILINGNQGSAVRAVHQGKVLYSDWLRGFGLVTVIDHGKGYMSLYGHNQALLKQAGEVVTAGETIALVGQSGGQTSPSLYFEIRHKGKALNPTSWIASR